MSEDFFADLTATPPNFEVAAAASQPGITMSEPNDQREIVIHHDDLGGSHGANLAFVELCDLGVVTSGAVMVPCPWFPEIAGIARARPDLDVGVHLTLTSEFSPFRWRPLTGVADNGLCDADGFFWSRVEPARRADPRAVEAELRAQIDTALAAGIDATHLDAHMGTAWQPEFLDIYLKLGADYRLPILLSRDVAKMAPAGTRFEPAFERLAARGNPDFAKFLSTPFGNLAPDEATYREIFAAAAPGLNWGAFHFARPGDFEMISPDAPTRTAEYELFRSGRGKALIAEAGLTPVGMRGFREAMRGN
ncbi:MAG: polysaccharide deacetylase family protein [Devosia sp.]|nr:polysaccharide deacetylase family protein [Devosia sp.]